MTHSRLAALSTGLAILLAGSPSGFAQLPAARLVALTPAGGKIGSSLDVSAKGADLDDAARLVFSHPGLSGTVKEGTTFRVTVGTNVPPGTYDARVAGRFGLSNPRRFVVGTLAERTAPSTNTAQASAFEISLNQVVHGTVTARTIAWFKFSAKKGQRMFVDCLARALDSKLAPALAILDAEGREWERARKEDVLDFTAPADGTYYIRLADQMYRGGDEYFFRLALTTGPRVDFVLPLAGAPGTRTNFTLYGRNLPGGKPVKGLTLDGKPLESVSTPILIPKSPEDQAVTSLPGSAGLDTMEYRFRGANPVTLAILPNPAPVLVEQEPNTKAEQAQRITAPAEISGQLFPAGDVDRFVFDAKKGDGFRLEVASQRLGAPTAPYLIVQRLAAQPDGSTKATDVLELLDGEGNIGDREFSSATRDPVGRLEIKEDGTYRVEVRDTFGVSTASPRHTYHLSLRREVPDFRLVAQFVAPKYKGDAKNIDTGIPVLRRGETIPVRVLVFRRDGFAGEIELGLENPPPGLHLVSDRIEASKNSDYILLTASADAPPFAGPVRLVGRAKVGDRELVRVARGGTLVTPVGNTDTERPESRLAQEFALAITDKESAPVRIAPRENRSWDAPANGKIEIPLAVTRQGEFNANLKLKPLGPGAADALKEFEADGKATNATLKLDFAALKLSPGRHVFAVQTITTGKYRNNPEAAGFAEAQAKEADKAAADAASAAKKAAADVDVAKKAADAADAKVKETESQLAAAKAKVDAAKAEPAKAEGAKTDAPPASATTELQAAQEAAKKARDEAVAQAKAAAAARDAAVKARDAAEARAKEAQARKDETARRAKELAEKAKPRDVSYQVTSAPIVVEVKPAPAPAPEAKDKPKDKESKQPSK